MFWQHYPDSTDVFVGISFNPKQDKTGQHHFTIACYQFFFKFLGQSRHYISQKFPKKGSAY